jgi:integrase/recombinase XerD
MTFNLPHVKRLYELVDKMSMGHNWKAYIDAFLYGCRMKNLSPNTINGYAERLNYLARFLDAKGVDIEDVTKLHLQEYVMSLINNPAISDATVNGRITVYKIFWNYLEDEEFWTKPNPAGRLKKIKAKKEIRDTLTPEQISLVAGTANKKIFIGYRNYCMLMLFYDTMIRRNELLTLSMDNVDLKNGLIKVLGKGNKERFVAMGTKMQKILHFYFQRWRKDLPGDLVFCTHQGRALDKDNCRQIVWRMGRKVGLHITPHKIRHSSAIWFIRSGGSPAILQKIMGHTSPVITAGYTHLDYKDLVRASQKFSPGNAVAA